MTHSKGPWQISLKRSQLTIIAIGYGGHDLPIAEIVTPSNSAHQELANARLIAASPDLLQALLYARALLPEKVPAADPQAAEKAATLVFIDEAIARATGEVGDP